MFTVPQLKQAADIIAAERDMTTEQARQYIGELNRENPAAISDILKSGHSGKKNPETDGKTETGSQRARSKRATDHVSRVTERVEHPATDHGEIVKTCTLETVQGEIITDDTELPAGLTDDIERYLSDFATKYNLDLVKASGTQWRAACIYIGQKLQKSGVLLDHKRMKEHGGKIYNAERIAALIPVWEYLTSLYRHVPLHGDFISFVGVSSEWLTDSRGVLTSSRVGIVKKLQEIEERALSAAITDHKENPTGRIYYTKARLGWRESVEIVHTSAASVGTLDDIPKLTDKGG